MNEITRNLWIGDLPSARNTEELRKNKIYSVLSVMRGKLKINETLNHHQIEIDDSQDADVLSQFLPAVHFLGGELGNGKGVLVHCQAGISRSPTIVAAYLIYTLKITPDEALGMILQQRPFVQPNPNFLRQLGLFHNSQGTVSKKDKDIRRFYLERAVDEVMNNDGSLPTTKMLSDFPNSSGSDSVLNPPTMSSTTTTTLRQRKIRCKMCRQDLATREHMLDHGQMGPSTSALSITTRRDADYRRQPLDSDPDSTSNNGARPEGIASRQSLPDSVVAGTGSEVATSPDGPPPTATTSLLKGPSDLASQLYSDHKLAALRIQPPSPAHHKTESNQQEGGLHTPYNRSTPSRPALINPKCSGYFIEPMKWMDHFLSDGSLAGKITCPNKKCNAKLGNYDWAGVCCGCKIWVTPGFCINRSKVDEVASTGGRPMRSTVLLQPLAAS